MDEIQMYTKIRNLRESLNMSQDELARKTGYTSRSTITKIEAGKIELTQSKLELFAKALHATPAYLLGWEDIEKKEHTITELDTSFEILLYQIETNSDIPTLDGQPLSNAAIKVLKNSIESVLVLLRELNS